MNLIAYLAILTMPLFPADSIMPVIDELRVTDYIKVTKNLGRGQYLVKFLLNENKKDFQSNECIFKDQVIKAYSSSSEDKKKLSNITVGSVFKGEYACRSTNNIMDEYFCSFIGEGINEKKIMVYFQPQDSEMFWKQCNTGKN